MVEKVANPYSDMYVGLTDEPQQRKKRHKVTYPHMTDWKTQGFWTEPESRGWEKERLNLGFDGGDGGSGWKHGYAFKKNEFLKCGDRIGVGVLAGFEDDHDHLPRDKRADFVRSMELRCADQPEPDTETAGMTMLKHGWRAMDEWKSNNG